MNSLNNLHSLSLSRNNRYNINLLYFNVCSLLPKIDHLRSICSLYSPDVICIVESWLDDTILDIKVCIQGYSLCRLDRTRYGGGVLIFVFTFSVIFKGTHEFECLALSVHNCNK